MPPDGKLTYGQVVLGWVDAVKVALDCRDEKRALATFVKAGRPAEAKKKGWFD
jgi:hypothetical protein